ncbi:MAG: type II secretion system F family protein [Acidobacteria bacterium]|nr:type II secretion system F family protein [Acidobacteriota bacterium]
MILVITISIFACVTLVALGAYWMLFRPASAATERLRRMGGLDGASRAGAVAVAAPSAEETGVAAIASRVVAPLNKIVPTSAAESKKLQLQLMQAGFRSQSAPVTFRAVHFGAMLGLPGAVALACAVLARPLDSAVTWILLAFVAGFFLPRYVLRKLIKRRQRLVQWGLADALDLLVVSIEAGLGLNAAIVKVADELQEVHRDISDEFELTNLEIRVGRDREEALRNLAERTGVDDLRSLVAMLIQADRFGTSIARAVRVYSDSLRTKRRQRAEQAAQKAAVKLLFPLACFLFPTLFIAILGPAALNLIDTFGKM